MLRILHGWAWLGSEGTCPCPSPLCPHEAITGTSLMSRIITLPKGWQREPRKPGYGSSLQTALESPSLRLNTGRGGRALPCWET